MKRTVVTSSYLTIRWHVVPLLDVRHLHQCRSCSAGAAYVGRWADWTNGQVRRARPRFSCFCGRRTRNPSTSRGTLWPCVVHMWCPSNKYGMLLRLCRWSDECHGNLSGHPATAKHIRRNVAVAQSCIGETVGAGICRLARHFLDTVREPLGQGSANCDPRAAPAPRLHFLRRANHVLTFWTDNSYLITS